MTMDEIRKRIDSIDARLVMLLNERTRLAVAVGRLKRRAGADFYTPHREEAVLRQVLARTRGPLTEEAVRAIWREVMSAALAAEKRLVIVYVGAEGSPAHEAARYKFGASLRYKPLSAMTAICPAIEKEQADYGVVPIEQVKDGVRTHVSDLLRDSELKICAEIARPSRHFVIGSQSARRSGRDKTALLFTLANRVGALESALALFRKHGINLLTIESRPVTGDTGPCVFFIELRGHAEDRAVAKALTELARQCDLVKILGSYAEQDT
jgi:chorismate mutase-like protein